MRLYTHILGSGTCVPSLERSSCSALVRGTSAHILLDAGPGTMGQLLKLGVHITDIDYILLSHLHLDHCAEVAPFLFALKYSGMKRHKPLVLVGGTGIAPWFESLNKTFEHTLDLPEEGFKVMELGEEGTLPLNLEGIRLDYARVKHKPESRSFRITDRTGFSLVYSGDTDYSESLVDLARNADILICESSFPDDQKVSGHLTPSLAGEMADKAQVKTLVLTHFYPPCEGEDLAGQCGNTFKGKIVLARDLMAL